MCKILALSAVIIALSACSGGKENADDKLAESSQSVAGKIATSAFTVNPGLWETKITIKTVDAKTLPEAAKKQMLAAFANAVTVKNCVTKEQSKKPGAEFFGSPNSSNCSIGALAVAGDQMTVKLTCKPDPKTVIESSMAGTFGAESYAMDIQQKTSGTPMGDLIMAGKVVGKRLGDCPA